MAPGECAPVPELGCQAPSGKATLRLRNGRRDARDRLEWKWRNGGPLVAADLGPSGPTSDYRMCVYADDRLVLSALAPHGTCEGRPCWKAAPRGGFTYRDRGLTPNGLSAIVLRTGKAGLIIVRGKGHNLAMPELPLTTPVAVQLVRTDGGACWESTITTPRVNSAVRFRGRSG
jgi:hypothetical protein